MNQLFVLELPHTYCTEIATRSRNPTNILTDMYLNTQKYLLLSATRVAIERIKNIRDSLFQDG